MNLFTTKVLDELLYLKDHIIQDKNFCSCEDHQYCICEALDKIINELKWHPIETAPHDRCIMIFDGVCLPDIVFWKSKMPGCSIDGTQYLERPEGWFLSNGGRSKFDTDGTMKAQFWKDI